MLFFLFFSMRLSRSDDPSHESSELTQVISYVLFLIDLFFMGLPWSYNQGRRFDLLTRVFFFQLHHSILV